MCSRRREEEHMQTLVFDNIRDFDLAHSFECGQCFRWNRGKSDGAYLGVVGEYACRASLSDSQLTLSVSGGDEAFWRNYFDLDTDYSEIKARLIEAEPRIAPAIEAGYGIRILRQDCFETLISFIISQNNNIPRIKKCIEGLCESYGHIIEGEVRVETRTRAEAGTENRSEARIRTRAEAKNARRLYAFPTPEALANAKIEDLAPLKLGYRDKYIIEASKRYVAEGAPSPKTISSYLGVGPKVASCIRLFGMRCTDAFPIDVWVKKIMADMYGFDESDIKGMQNFAEERFGSLGGYAQQYLFNYYRNVKTL